MPVAGSTCRLRRIVFEHCFALALSQALVRGLEVDCGCFGSGQPSVFKTWASLGRDLLLMAATGWIYHFQLKGRKFAEESILTVQDVERS